MGMGDLLQLTVRAAWENFKQTMDNIAQWKRWFREHDRRILQVRSVDDIHIAKQQSKTIVLGFQNTSA
jgi:membrane dipeptidase